MGHLQAGVRGRPRPAVLRLPLGYRTSTDFVPGMSHAAARVLLAQHVPLLLAIG